MQVNEDILMLFAKTPDALPLFEAADKLIQENFPQAVRKVSKTQVSYTDRYGFAWLWPPIRRRKGWPHTCLLVTFGLGHRVEHPRIVQTVEPYPNRWTHHVLLTHPGELDQQLLEWLRQSHTFSINK